jgi:hypothetical protein
MISDQQISFPICDQQIRISDQQIRISDQQIMISDQQITTFEISHFRTVFGPYGFTTV